MNESTWVTTTDPFAMLDVLFPVRGMDSTEPQSRQSRLYLLGCARRAWDRLPGVCRAVVAAAERVYHPRAPDPHLRDARDAVYPHAEALVCCRGEADDVNAIGRALVGLGCAAAADVWADRDADPDEWAGVAHLAYLPFARATPHFRHVPAGLHSAALAREVFPNPFDPPGRFDRRWATGNVRNLALQADAAGESTNFMALADALEEADCDDPRALDHLRRGGPHARGCWAVEWVLSGR